LLLQNRKEQKAAETACNAEKAVAFPIPVQTLFMYEAYVRKTTRAVSSGHLPTCRISRE
jgi:hypothetical protein